LVGSFLEHSRIYRFGGGPKDPSLGEGLPLKIYIGSADLMGRNLDRRVEVLVPIHDPELQARLFEVLDLVFADETNTWELGPDRRWRRVENVHGVSAQARLKELAIERARRRRDGELRVGELDQFDAQP
jgi:polyphosphate kinase